MTVLILRPPQDGDDDGRTAARVRRALHTLAKAIASPSAPNDGARAVPEEEETARRDLLVRALVQEVIQQRGGSLDQLIPPTGASRTRGVECSQEDLLALEYGNSTVLCLPL